MPPKKKVDLPDHVRKAALDDVKLSQDTSVQAEQNFKIRIFLATEQGLSTYEIAEKLAVSQQVVSKYKRQGEEAYLQREREGSGPAGENSDRPGESEQVG